MCQRNSSLVRETPPSPLSPLGLLLGPGVVGRGLPLAGLLGPGLARLDDPPEHAHLALKVLEEGPVLLAARPGDGAAGAGQALGGGGGAVPVFVVVARCCCCCCRRAGGSSLALDALDLEEQPALLPAVVPGDAGVRHGEVGAEARGGGDRPLAVGAGDDVEEDGAVGDSAPRLLRRRRVLAGEGGGGGGTASGLRGRGGGGRGGLVRGVVGGEGGGEGVRVVVEEDVLDGRVVGRVGRRVGDEGEEAGGVELGGDGGGGFCSGLGSGSGSGSGSGVCVWGGGVGRRRGGRGTAGRGFLMLQGRGQGRRGGGLLGLEAWGRRDVRHHQAGGLRRGRVSPVGGEASRGGRRGRKVVVAVRARARATRRGVGADGIPGAAVSGIISRGEKDGSCSRGGLDDGVRCREGRKLELLGV
ncbi:hypothetical protein LZ31DRAFT_612726, partial [Colletotrichum somersetense]